MPLTHLRRPLTRAAVLLAAALAVVGLSACGGSDITRARLERSLPQTFANLYVQQAKLLGHQGITVRSLHPRASCDKGGPKKPDTGPGADWICQMSWQDPNVPLPDGFGKFELNVHSNDCYTAGGPSKLVGLITIADTHGTDVDNPVFEFDGCFDPHGSDKPTGVTFATTSTTPATPAAGPATLTLPTGRLSVDPRGTAPIVLICATGDGGCAGTLTATSGARTLGRTTYAVAAGKNATVALPLHGARPGARLTLRARPVIGTVQPATSTVAVARAGGSAATPGATARKPW
ncbi:MAG: hypothetical protein JWM31_206 [Solirubrobacterales bacterium]|nr:hypothetical protein [Solirubrobacterales bacterium]